MKTKFICMIIIATTVTTIHMHAMELALLSKKPNYGSLSHYEIQLKLPNDTLNQIIAYCSHSTRCKLQETCKQLCFLASINRLNELMDHNFNIGEAADYSAFFRAFIKNNNPNHVTTILNYARKEALLYDLKTDDEVRITLDNDNKFTQEMYIQKNYLDHLLEETAKQKNTIMQDALISLGGDIEIVNAYTEKQCIYYENIGMKIFIPIFFICLPIGIFIGGFMDIYNHRHYTGNITNAPFNNPMNFI